MLQGEGGAEQTPSRQGFMARAGNKAYAEYPASLLTDLGTCPVRPFVVVQYCL